MNVINTGGTVYKINRLERQHQLLPIYPQDFSCSTANETLLSCIIPTYINVDVRVVPGPTAEVGINCTATAMRKFCFYSFHSNCFFLRVCYLLADISCRV